MENEVKERIKVKADELFYKYGIKTITMDEIAGQLGISKKTIYLSFKDKDELVDEVFNDIISRTETHCCHLKNRAKNAIHEGFLAMQMMEEIYGNINPIILYDLERHHPATFNRFKHFRYKFLYQSLFENIEAGKKEELFRDDINIEVAVKLRLETMLMPFNPDIFPKNKFNFTELQKEFIELYLFSLVTPKGYKMILKYKEQQIKKG